MKDTLESSEGILISQAEKYYTGKPGIQKGKTHGRI
jgi:hypothetical protein